VFVFHKYPTLTDGCIALSVEREYDGDPPRGWAPSYDFRICLRDRDVRVGSISLRVGDTDFLRLYAGHVGYGISPAHRGHRYAARACLLLRGVALDHGMEDLWITCNPDNLASRRTCELLGARLIEIIDLPPDTELYRRGERQKCRYRWRVTTDMATVTQDPLRPPALSQATAAIRP